MRKLIVWILGFFGFLIFAYISLVLLSKFGQVTTKYRCTGQMPNTEEKSIVYLKFELYRPIIFWGKSAGRAWSEIPNKTIDYYSTVTNNGEIMILGREDKPLMGTFSTLSNSVMLDIEGNIFTGECRIIKSE